MGVRKWNQDSELRVPIVPGTMLEEIYSVAVVHRPSAIGAFQTLMAGHDAAGEHQWVFGIDNTNSLLFYVRGGNITLRPSTPITVTDTTKTLGLAFTKTDSDAGTFHLYDFDTDEYTHTPSDGVGTIDAPADTDGGYIAFGATKATFDRLGGVMSTAAVHKVADVNADFEALFTDRESADWQTHFAAGGAWNFDQTVNTDPVPDMAGNHAPIVGTITGATDTNGISGTTIVTDQDPPGWDFDYAATELVFTTRLSGGASNSDPSLSIGGAESSVQVGLGLIPGFPRQPAIDGQTTYHGVFVHNEDLFSPATVGVYLTGLDLSAGVAIAIGVAIEDAGEDAEELDDWFTAPTGVAFSTPTSAEDALDMDTLGPDQGRLVWVRLTIAPNSAGALHNAWDLALDVTPQ